jgi:hypothetical protein
MDLPSSIAGTLERTTRSYARIARHSVAMTIHRVVTNHANVFSFGGFSKLGVMPSGGLSAGCARSCSRAAAEVAMMQVHTRNTERRLVELNDLGWFCQVGIRQASMILYNAYIIQDTFAKCMAVEKFSEIEFDHVDI